MSVYIWFALFISCCAVNIPQEMLRTTASTFGEFGEFNSKIREYASELESALNGINSAVHQKKRSNITLVPTSVIRNLAFSPFGHLSPPVTAINVTAITVTNVTVDCLINGTSQLQSSSQLSNFQINNVIPYSVNWFTISINTTSSNITNLALNVTGIDLDANNNPLVSTNETRLSLIETTLTGNNVTLIPNQPLLVNVTIFCSSSTNTDNGGNVEINFAFSNFQSTSSNSANNTSSTTLIPGSESSSSFSLVKNCRSPPVNPCLNCDFCTNQNTCECIVGKIGSMCVLSTANITANSTQATFANVMSLGVNGLGFSFESKYQIVARITAIANEILALSPDVICLQEVWSDDQRQVLIEILSSAYPYMVAKSFFNGPSPPDSGLFLASRFPMLDNYFEAFIARAAADAGLNKGFLISRLNLGKKTVIILNTHLQSSLYFPEGTSFAESIRSFQLDQIAGSLEAQIDKSLVDYSANDTYIIAVGNFEMLQMSSEYYTQTDKHLQSGFDVFFKFGDRDSTFGIPGDLVCNNDINNLLETASQFPCVVQGPIIKFPATIIDYMFYWTEWSPKFGSETLVFNTPTFSDVHVIPLATQNVFQGYGGVMSTHGALWVSLSIDPVNDPSLAIAITLFILSILIGAYIYFKNKNMKHIQRELKDSDMEASFVSVFFRQTGNLIQKNFILQTRNRKAFVTQLLVPIIFMAFLRLLQLAVVISQNASSENGVLQSIEPVVIPSLSRCKIPSGQTSCVSIMYSPRDDPLITTIMNNIAIDNSIPESEMMPMATQNDVDTYLINNPQQVLSAVDFYHPDSKTIAYTMQFNHSIYGTATQTFNWTTALPLQVALDQEIMRVVGQVPSLKYVPSIAKFPHPPIGNVDLIVTAGPIFFYGAMMFNFVIQMAQIVTEKEFFLRQGMAVMGLNSMSYWLSYIVSNTIMNTLSSVSLIIGGFIFQFTFFTKNDGGLYIALFFLFGLSMVSFAFFLSLFLSKSKTATSVGFAVFLLGVITQGFTTTLFSPTADEALQTFCKFLPFLLLAEGVSVLGNAVTGDNVGLKWSMKGSNAYFPLQQVYQWFLIDFIFYLAIAVFLDFYFSNEDPRNFCRKKKIVTRDPLASLDGNGNKIPREVKFEFKKVENDKLNSRYAIRIFNLYKSYNAYFLGLFPNPKKDFLAVNGLNLAIPSGELLCLLGPNGAGKTTTMKILTGIHKLSSGEVFIYKNDVNSGSGMREIRKTLGFCPQHDILWGELTAREHLRLFAGFKNIPLDLVEYEVEERLKDVHLTKWADAPSSSFSGGMQRRLSVAMSLIGNPKVVFLDEPTTGMDPVSRRQVWDLIERVKRGRVVILTTHSMEEADILGDRIAIMKKGQLSTIGSSISLKNKFGNGYRLGFKFSTEYENITSLLSNNLNTVKVLSCKNNLISVEIDRANVPNLPKLLKAIEDESKNLAITDVELSISTLQEVFLKIAEEEGDNDEQEQDEQTSLGNNKYHENLIGPGEYKFSSQFSALLGKSYLNQKRARCTNFAQCLIPCCLIILLFLLQIVVNSVVSKDGSIAANLTPSAALNILIRTSADEVKNCVEIFKANIGNFPLSDSSGANILYSIAKNNQSPFIGSYGDPPVDSIWYTPSIGVGVIGDITKNISDMTEKRGQIFVNQGGRNQLCQLTSYYAPLNFIQKNDPTEISNVLYDAYGQSDQSYLGGYIFNDMDRSAYVFNTTIIANETLTKNQDVPVFMSYITRALMQNLFSVNMTYLGIRDFPQPASSPTFDLISLIGPFLYIYIFQLMMPVITASVVYEKEHSLREVMKMMGLKQHIYWIVTYIFNYLLYFIITALTLILAFIFKFRIFTANSPIIVAGLFFFWGHTLVAFAFFMSVFFVNTRTANVVSYIYVFAIGILAIQLVQTLLQDPSTSSSTIFGLSCIPQFALFRGLYELSNAVTFGKQGLVLDDFLNNPNVHISQVYWFLIVEWAVLLLLSFYLEAVLPSSLGVKSHPLFPLHYLFSCCKKKKNDIFVASETNKEMYPEGEGRDVLAARKKTYNDKESLLRIYNLKKVYPANNGVGAHTAVHNLTFSVKQGECFGFLGPNGAGKSTTMNMLCGYFGPTSGTAKVMGFDIRTDMSSIHMLIGVCPQENVLWEELTGREHLMFYGKLKGMTKKELQAAVNYRLGQVDLLTAGDKKAGTYSGGMKRRLCVAIALVGNPKVVILDEPSTGLDPKARKDLWRVIKNASKTSAVLLTTHSMEEAEQLCTNIGIFIAGKINCMGSAAELKSRLGDGYYIHVACKRGANYEMVENYIKDNIPGVQLINSLNGTLNFQVQAKKSKLSTILGAMVDESGRLLQQFKNSSTRSLLSRHENVLSSLSVSSTSSSLSHAIANIEEPMTAKQVALSQIEDWSVENTTLEQVFIRITSQNNKIKTVPDKLVDIEAVKIFANINSSKNVTAVV